MSLIYRRDRAQREYEGFRMASEPDSLFFALSAEIRNNIYTLIFEHEDPIYVIQASKDPDPNPVLHRCVGDRNRGLINPGKCRSRPSCYTTLDILTFAR
jgi:hypothetical protein